MPARSEATLPVALTIAGSDSGGGAGCDGFEDFVGGDRRRAGGGHGPDDDGGQ